MKVSVVICTYGVDRISDLIEAVNSILNQSYSNYEILIVADNDERLLSSLRKSSSIEKAKIVLCEERGLSNARNCGIKNSTGDIVAFLDDDSFADKNWLSNIVNNYGEDPNIVGVGGFIKSEWEGKRQKWFPEELDWIVGCTYEGHPNDRCDVRNIIGCNMSFKREVFEKVGIFESSIGRVGKKLLAGEEMEFCTRISTILPQAKIIYDPSAVIYHKVHKHRQSLSYVLRRAYNEGISKSMISKLRRHRTSTNILSTENQYIKYLVEVSVPERISEVVNKRKNVGRNIKHITIMIVAIAIVFLGYAFGKLTTKKERK